MPSKEWYDSNKEKQLAYNKEYAKNNPEKTKYLKARSSARSFIRTKAMLEDLEELECLIEERRNQLK